MLDRLTIDDFRARLGEPVRIAPAVGPAFDAELASVTPLRGGHPELRVPFSVVLFASRGELRSQQSCRVEVAGIGALELLVVPIGPDAAQGGMRYEVVFG